MVVFNFLAREVEGLLIYTLVSAIKLGYVSIKIGSIAVFSFSLPLFELSASQVSAGYEVRVDPGRLAFALLVQELIV